MLSHKLSGCLKIVSQNVGLPQNCLTKCLVVSKLSHKIFDCHKIVSQNCLTKILIVSKLSHKMFSIQNLETLKDNKGDCLGRIARISGIP